MSTNEDPRREVSGADQKTTARSAESSMPNSSPAGLTADEVLALAALSGPASAYEAVLVEMHDAENDDHAVDRAVALTAHLDAAYPEYVTAMIRKMREHLRRPPCRRAPSTSRRFAGLLRKVMEAPEGTRNGTLYWSACRAAEMAAEGAISQEQAEEALTQAAEHSGLHYREAIATIRSAFRRIGGA